MKEIFKKVITYRCLIMSSQLIFLYLITGNLEFASGISLVFGGIATIEHAIFERVWHRNNN